MFHCIKQLEEKAVATEIDFLVWSDRMDLVALSNVKGEIALHRLTWARAVSLGPYKEGVTVKGLAWKPDGKIIAIGYSTSKVILMNVENKALINKLDVKGEISYMYWVKEKCQNKNVKITSDQEVQKDYLKYIDNSATFLPDPPPLSNFGSSNSEENYSVNCQKQTELNMLIIGTAEGLIYISIFGCSPWIIFDLSKHLGYRCSILSILLSEELDLLYATVRDQSGNVKIAVVNTLIFKTHTKELFAVSMKHEYLNCLLNYLLNTISVIKETWENILLEMDAKLSKYASKVPEGTLATDFLDLLMFGITTEHMQEFLLHDLTKKGLEKFGQTIEMSYANIQKLLLKNVTKVGQNITYHLAELRGMARLEYRYKILGLNEDEITEAISASGSFLTKSGEMQQIINTSMINYKAFFRWLYSAIIHLIDEQVPPEIPKMTQQDVAHITEFLLNFDNITSGTSPEGGKKFVMEKLGQYLVDAPLTIPSEIESNDWNAFLRDNVCVRTHQSIFKHYRKMSLIQQFNMLKDSVSRIFDKLQHSLVEEFKLVDALDVINVPHPGLKIANVTCGPSTVLFGLLSSPSDGFYFLEVNTDRGVGVKGGSVFVPQYLSQESESFGENYDVVDVQFYTANLLSLLLQEKNGANSSLLCQCPTMILREKIAEINLKGAICREDLPKVNASTLGNLVMKNLDGVTASGFAVSGVRKVSVVLADNRRKVRIYEMEAEEDEEEDAEMTNSTVRESDVSMPENSDGD